MFKSARNMQRERKPLRKRRFCFSFGYSFFFRLKLVCLLCVCVCILFRRREKIPNTLNLSLCTGFNCTHTHRTIGFWCFKRKKRRLFYTYTQQIFTHKHTCTYPHTRTAHSPLLWNALTEASMADGSIFLVNSDSCVCVLMLLLLHPYTHIYQHIHSHSHKRATKLKLFTHTHTHTSMNQSRKWRTKR